MFSNVISQGYRGLLRLKLAGTASVVTVTEVDIFYPTFDSCSEGVRKMLRKLHKPEIS